MFVFCKRPNQSRKPQYRQIALQKNGNRRRLWRLAVASYVCLYSCKLQFIGESAMVGRALTKTFIHNPLMLLEPSAIPLWYIWSYENKFSRPYMP